jgi:N-acetylglucosaminyl-diphospho-decaprenol L-rhamnosyltransferase
MNGQGLGGSRSIDLSVIVVTYNSRDLTLACVASVVAEQKATPSRLLQTELIVVDNGSSDGTTDAVRKAAPEARVLVQPANLGFAGGNNVGLAAAQGRYLLLLNSDAEVRPGAFAALVAFMDAHPDAGACGPMLVNPDGSLQPTGRDLPTPGTLFLDMTKLYRLWKRDLYVQRGRDYTEVAAAGELSAAALLVRRSVYQQVGGLDTGFFFYYEDVDWCKRIGDAGYRIYYVPTAEVMHRWQGTSRSVSTLAYRSGQDSLRYYFRKHHGPLAGAAVQVMLAGKEGALLLASALRRNQAGVLLHRQMLRRALAPLETPTAVPPVHVKETP